MKIAIVGYSGSGKSTLAKKLGKYYNVDVLHLDTVHHLSGWKEREIESELAIVNDFLINHSSWVVDGNYSKLYYDQLMEEADLIIMLLFNRFNCLWRAIKRYQKYKGKTRPDMTVGCDEKIDREFVWWILHKGRTNSAKERYAKIQTQYPEKIIVLKNQKQLDKYELSIKLK